MLTCSGGGHHNKSKKDWDLKCLIKLGIHPSDIRFGCLSVENIWTNDHKSTIKKKKTMEVPGI
jgi:hypothetical protein